MSRVRLMDRIEAWFPEFLVLTSLLMVAVTHGLYIGLDREPPRGFHEFHSLGVAASVISWFWSYSQRHRIKWPLDMGAFLVLGWIFIVPYYVFKTEGRRGWGLIAVFVAAYVASLGIQAAIAIWLQLLLR